MMFIDGFPNGSDNQWLYIIDGFPGEVMLVSWLVNHSLMSVNMVNYDVNDS